MSNKRIKVDYVKVPERIATVAGRDCSHKSLDERRRYIRVPEKQTKGAAAYDLYVPTDTLIKQGRNVVPLGFRMEMPDGYRAHIDPRSGYSSKGMEGYDISEETINKLSEADKDEIREKCPLPVLKPVRFYHFGAKRYEINFCNTELIKAFDRKLEDVLNEQFEKYCSDPFIVDWEHNHRYDCDVVQGKIDADYRGEVGVIINNHSEGAFWLKAGTRIAQMEFVQVETAIWTEKDELSETDRGAGGFGSTNK